MVIGFLDKIMVMVGVMTIGLVVCIVSLLNDDMGLFDIGVLVLSVGMLSICLYLYIVINK